MFNFPQTPSFYTFNDVARKSETFLTKAVDLQKDINDLGLTFFDSGYRDWET